MGFISDVIASPESQELIAKTEKAKDEEAALRESQAESIQSYKDYLGDLYPVLLSQYGYREDEAGKIVPMTEEERLAGMTPLERQQYQNALLQQQYATEMLPYQQELAKAQAEEALKAQRGELELPEYMKQDIEEMRQLENQRLSERLGSNWYMSSPGIQTASEAAKRESAIKSAYGHGEKTTAANLLSQSLGGISGTGGQSFGGYLSGTQAGQQGFLSGMGTYGSMYGQVPGMYGAAQQPYQYYQGLYNQQQLQQAANKAGLIGDVFGLAGVGLGSALKGGA